MKIAQLVSTFPPYYGGMGNVAHNYAANLANRGHQVTVFTPLMGEKYFDLATEFKIVRLPPALKYGNAAYLSKLHQRLADFDLVHLHYPFLGSESILKTTRPLIITYHMDLIGQGWKKAFFKYYQKIFLPKFLAKSQKVIFTSQDYLDYCLAAVFKSQWPDKFAVIPLGVEKSFKPKANFSQGFDFWSKFGVKEKKIILFVGGLDRAHYFKGLSNLIAVMARFKKMDLALAIVGDGDLKQSYIDLARSQDLKSIYFLGRIKTADLIECYQNCDFVVLSSIDSSEAFGLVIVEAFACAKPVIASALPGVRSLINQGVDGLLVKPGDINDLAEKILRIFDLDLKKMGAAGSEKVEKSYRWPRIAEQIEKVYWQVI